MSDEARAQMEANREMWNATARVHERASLEKLLERVEAPDFSTFDLVERRIFDQIGLEGKDVAQLSCNNGRELISCKKAGAKRCVGFDISDAFVAQAKRLARASGLDVDFVRANVYDIPESYNESFDIVYVTIGAIGWLPDLDAYLAVVARLLRPGGHFFLYEMHPVLFMFEAETGLEVKKSYFDKRPDVEETAPDYLDPSQIVEGASYWFQHTLGEIIGGCLKMGLELTFFAEYPHDLSAVYAAFEQFETKPPLSYALVARKPG